MKKLFSLLLVFSVFLSSDIIAFSLRDSGDEIVELSEDGIYLHLENIRDLSVLDDEYPNLKEIYCENCLIKGDEKILQTPTAKSVYFNYCEFSSSELKLSDSVTELTLSCIETMPSVKGGKNLKKLSVLDSRMKDLTCFSNMGKMECVTFSCCQIGSIAGIEKGNEIEELEFTDVPIESIEELSNLKGLRLLDLSSTAVRDLSPLENVDLCFLAVHDSLMIENLDVITKIETLNEIGTTNCQMLYTPELIDYLERNDISSHYKKGDLELKEKVLEQCRKIEKKYLTDEEKIGATVKFACEQITYDLEVYSNDSLTMEYGNNILKYAFEGTGCCSTYTGLVAMMLNEMGIDCYSVSGDNHIWNLVELDGYCYWLDATWIDTGWEEYLDESPYYMTTSEDFLYEHSDFLAPYRIIENSHSFEGTFECKTRFKLREDSASEEYLGEKPTLPEITTQAEVETEVETETKVTEKDKTEETTTETEKETDGEEKDKKPIVIICVSVAALGIIAVIAIVIVKKRNKPIN